MKVFSGILAVLGLILVLAAAGLAIYNGVRIWNLFQMATINRSQPGVDNPNLYVGIQTAGAMVGGLLLGLGLAMPKRSRATANREAVEAYKAQAHAEDERIRHTTTDTVE